VRRDEVAALDDDVGPPRLRRRRRLHDRRVTEHVPVAAHAAFALVRRPLLVDQRRVVGSGRFDVETAGRGSTSTSISAAASAASSGVQRARSGGDDVGLGPPGGLRHRSGRFDDAPLIPRGVGVVARAKAAWAATGTCSVTRRSLKGDAGAAIAAADVVVKSRYPRRRLTKALRSSRGRFLAQWQGDRVTVWSSTQVPFARAERSRACPADPGVERSRDRAAARPAGSGSKCDFHFRGSRRGARCAPPPGEAGLHARGGIRRAGSRREGMLIEPRAAPELTGRSSPAAADCTRRRRLLGEGGFSPR